MSSNSDQPSRTLEPAVRAARRAGTDWLPAGAILLLAVVASVACLRNGFAFDDVPILLHNPRVHTLHSWWRIFAEAYWPPAFGSDMYRPLSILVFALEWALGGGAPWLLHLASVALYAAVAMAFYSLAAMLLPRAAAWVTAAVFAVHPVHVEVVGNVVGQGELLVSLATLLAVVLYLRWRRGLARRGVALPAIVALYALACLAKEQGILLPALLLAAELTVVRDDRPLPERASALVPLHLVMVVAAVCYLGAREIVTGRLGSNAPHVMFAGMSVADRALTMLGLVPELARLLLWPVRLSAFYSPPGVRAVHGWEWGLLPGIMVAVGVAALAVVLWRRSPVVTLGLAWFGATWLPVSNVLFPSGVLLAERTLFLPSVGVLLAAGAGVAWLATRCPQTPRAGRLALAGGAAAAILGGLARSVERQAVWRDDESLFAASVEDAPLSYEAHHMYGRLLYRVGRRTEGELELRRALFLYKGDPDLKYALASVWREAGACRPALPLFREALAASPARADYRIGLVACLLHEAAFDEARAEARIGILRGDDRPSFERLFFLADSASGAQRLERRERTGALPTSDSRRVHDGMQNTTGAGSDGGRFAARKVL